MIEKGSAPLLSVVTVVKNAVDTIEDTIKSVLSQSTKNFEYVVVDGDSIDGTTEKIRKYSSEIDILDSRPDGGIYEAMNNAIRLCSGKYIQYLNADDRLFDSTVLEMVEKELIDSKPDILSGKIVLEYEGFAVIREAPLMRSLLRKAIMPPHQGMFIRKDLLDLTDGFSLEYRSSGDLDLLIRIVEQNPIIRYVPHVVAIMRSGGISSNKSISYRETGCVLRRHFGNAAALKYLILKRLFEQGLKALLVNILPARLYNLVRKRYLVGASRRGEKSGV